jgi:CHAT domain-containing protein/Tfp pilus assembly protein PilF
LRSWCTLPWSAVVGAVALSAAVGALAGCGAGRQERRQPTANLVPVPGRLATPPSLRRVFQLGDGPGTERELGPGEVDAYAIDLVAGEYLYTTVDQRGVDVKVNVFAPGHEPLFSVDGPYGAQGAEKVHLVAGATGRYRLEVSGSSQGRYLARLEVRRPATAIDQRRAAAERAFWEARWGLARKPGFWEAAAKLEMALRLFARLGAKDREAEAYYRLGKLQLEAKGDYRAALDLFQSANDLYRPLGDGKFIALTYNQIGRCYEELGDFKRAETTLRQALDAWLRRPLEGGRVVTLENLAQVHAFQGEVAEAVRFYRNAVELGGQLGDEESQAKNLTNLGWIYRSVGDMEQALAALRQALAAGTRISDRQRAATLNEMGNVYLAEDEPQLALPKFEQAWRLDSHGADLETQADTLSGLGVSYRRLAEFGKALAVYTQAREMFHTVGNRRAEANEWINMGSAYIHMQQPERAAACYDKALGLAQDTSYLATEAMARLGLGVAARDRGNLGQALRDGEDALKIVEAMRGGASRPDLQASYLELNEGHYGFLIDVLMHLHAMRPAGGFDRRALRYSEQARARGLLDALATRRALVSAARVIDPALLAERGRITRQIAAKDRELRGPARSEAPKADLEHQLDQLLERSRDLADRIRKAAPRSTPAGGEVPDSIAEAQQGSLDDRTLLLEYHVGAARSFLWAVTPHSIASFELPGNDRLEPLVRATYRLLSQSQPGAGAAPAAKGAAQLSSILLGQVADRLGDRRLLIVVNGALQDIPFAALPDPGRGNEPLMLRHEIVYAPSLAVLSELRASPPSKPRPSGLVAILADPVFGNQDERARAFNVPAAMLDPLVASLPRLPDSRDEANAIAKLAGNGVLEALGFDANSELVTSGRLRHYRILHFATHGTLRIDLPDLSGLALSQIDRTGRPRDGFLRAFEVQDLELPADLVVLSACKTALGKERGGDLFGLPYAFMSAGAQRVLVSLWDVGDRSTAELMRRFYRGLLVDKLPAAAALRAAQQTMWQDSRTRAPYHWGGFVLQGDWR